MSTFPFVPIKGALALPHVRPLVRLPESFGREWALTAPHFSLRAELRTLYAAIMRTVCLSTEVFRWNHCQFPALQPRGPVAAPPVEPETIGSPVCSPAAGASVPVISTYRTAPFERRKLAGGAVAIGGAALLAWIVASHTPHDTATGMTDTAQQPAAEASGPGSASALPRMVDGKSAKTISAPRPADQLAQATTASDQHSSMQTNDPVRAQPKAASPARLVPRDTRGSERAVNRAAGQRVAERGANLRHDAHEFAQYRETAPVTTHRSHGAYSEAQGYSPRQTGANQADDYASILAYAKTYAPAPTSDRPAIPADSTDWVNHVSQRRITEVPEQFAK